MNKLFTTSALLCALSLGFTSCSKDDDNTIVTEQEYQAKVTVKDGETVNLANISRTSNSQGTINRKGNVYSLRNFKQFTVGDDNKATTTAATTYYLDFKENDGASSNNFMVYVNAKGSNVDLATNSLKGYTLSYIDKAFDEVKATDQFVAAKNNLLGLQSAYAPNVIGWANYTGAPNHQVLAVANRTIIVLKDNKPFFKIRMNSVYENETMNHEVAPNNYFFYSIDYQELQ
ncbi:hypothetical protein OHD16_11290 [Sphingobacterium sp. ML3W]|uniref:hypothetical protein n=1 Tax=Sphingobacterium sp. ML3W TaxID=1538644 RepID=UPI00249B655B|nr:hypothetical protein [Sphingobacterium sp. ML3W]WFA80548.1 hypothetical protein OGI71_04435 [Sphingobacterium sp. ML3W]